MLELYQMPKMVPLPFRNGESHRHWMLLEDWIYKEWGGVTIIIEKGFVFNGASIPKIFSNIFASTGILFLAALVHDHLYQHRWIWIIEESITERFIRSGAKCGKKKLWCDKSKSDDIFGEIALISYPENRKAIKTAKFFLTVGGQGSWDKCRKIEGNYIPPKHPEGFDENFATKDDW